MATEKENKFEVSLFKNDNRIFFCYKIFFIILTVSIRSNFVSKTFELSLEIVQLWHSGSF